MTAGYLMPWTPDENWAVLSTVLMGLVALMILFLLFVRRKMIEQRTMEERLRGRLKDESRRWEEDYDRQTSTVKEDGYLRLRRQYQELTLRLKPCAGCYSDNPQKARFCRRCGHSFFPLR